MYLGGGISILNNHSSQEIKLCQPPRSPSGAIFHFQCLPEVTRAFIVIISLDYFITYMCIHRHHNLVLPIL